MVSIFEIKVTKPSCEMCFAQSFMIILYEKFQLVTLCLVLQVGSKLLIHNTK